MTPDEFRSNDELVKQARAIVESDVFKLMLEAMGHAAPVNTPAPRGITPTDANILLGEQTGYATYPQELLKLAKGPAMQKRTPPEDYSTSPLDEQTG